MLEAILNHIHNFFVVPGGAHRGTFTIASGTFTVDFLQRGQYFRVVGSIFNDGVYQYPASDLVDEEFTGEVWAMAVPPAVIALSKEIEAWSEDNPTSGFVSEAFGGYSYSRATTPGTGVPLTWESVFRARLAPWRKLS